jgi:mannose-6-phosphate isomerase-like protein (cupin superfamily)
MPVFTSSGPVPPWCEMREFGIHDLRSGVSMGFEMEHPRACFICTAGAIEIESDGKRHTLTVGERFESTGAGAVRLTASCDSQFFRAAGHWKEITGAGIFTVCNGAPVHGDPPLFNEKSTPFDNHFHDSDEYWILLDGRATVVSEEKRYRVAAGDCVATGRGWHHDFLSCDDERGVRAIWFESALEGRRRVGHLYDSQHGKAEPHRERV